jgi:hypothetical protein
MISSTSCAGHGHESIEDVLDQIVPWRKLFNRFVELRIKVTPSVGEYDEMRSNSGNLDTIRRVSRLTAAPWSSTKESLLYLGIGANVASLRLMLNATRLSLCLVPVPVPRPQIIEQQGVIEAAPAAEAPVP